MKKNIIIISILLFIIIGYYFTITISNFIANKNYERNEKLNVFPEPYNYVKLEYRYKKTNYALPKEEIAWYEKEFGKNHGFILNLKEQNINGNYIYIGSTKNGLYYDVYDKKIFLLNDDSYAIFSNVIMDDNYNFKFNFNNKYSSIKIDDEMDVLPQLVPLFGIYQPGQYIFKNSRIDYRNGKIILIQPTGSSFTYNKDGLVKSIKNYDMEYHFNNYKYFKSINMNLPTNIEWKYYESYKEIRLKKYLKKRVVLDLINTEIFNNVNSTFNSIQNPTDFSSVTYSIKGNSISYNYNPNMGNIYVASEKLIKSEDKKDIKKPIVSIILRLFSFVFLVLIIYLIIKRVKNEENR